MPQCRFHFPAAGDSSAFGHRPEWRRLQWSWLSWPYSPLLFDTGHKTTVATIGQRSSYTRCIAIFPQTRALVRPAARHNLGLRIEMYAVFPQCMQIAEE